MGLRRNFWRPAVSKFRRREINMDNVKFMARLHENGLGVKIK